MSHLNSSSISWMDKFPSPQVAEEARKKAEDAIKGKPRVSIKLPFGELENVDDLAEDPEWLPFRKGDFWFQIPAENSTGPVFVTCVLKNWKMKSRTDREWRSLLPIYQKRGGTFSQIVRRRVGKQQLCDHRSVG